MDIGRDVMMDSYTQYLQQVRKTKTGLTDFLWQETFHLEGRRTRRNITNTISDTKVLSFLTNTPKNTHLLLGILWLKCLKVRVRPLSKMYVFKMIFFPSIMKSVWQWSVRTFEKQCPSHIEKANLEKVSWLWEEKWFLCSVCAILKQQMVS